MIPQGINVFHLSDLHFSNRKSEIGHLISELSSELDCKPDFLVISGDIAHRGKLEPDYKKALETLRDIQLRLALDLRKVILVPGNHDVTRHSKKKFQNYIKFFNEFYKGTGRTFRANVNDNKLFSADYFDEDRILFVGANSAIKIDKTKKYGLIGKQQFSEIRKRLEILKDMEPNYDETLKIFVMHHSLEPYNENDSSVLRDQRYLKYFLRIHGFKFLLHGHVHFGETSSLYQNEKDLIICGAGKTGSTGKRGDGKYEMNHIKIDWLDESYGNNVQAQIFSYQYTADRLRWDQPVIKFPADEPYSFIREDPIIKLSFPRQFRADIDKQEERSNIILDLASNLQENIDTIYKASYIEFFDTKLAFKYYVDKLKKLKKGLLATSFLASSFWIVSDYDYNIIQTNIKTARRLKKKGIKEPIKRIFVLDKPIDRFIKLIVQSIVNEERVGIKNGIKERWSIAINNLEDMSTEVKMKVAYIPGDFWKKLKNDEIAFYDKRDFDFFKCDAENRIKGVKKIYNYENYPDENTNKEIKEILSLFETKWAEEEGNGMLSLDEFIKAFKRELSKADRNIRYGENWLYEYENDENSDDAKIKQKEASSLIEMLVGTKYKQHLDIGESYGRYPKLLVDKGIVAKSVGVDKRECCIQRAKANTEYGYDSKIKHIEMDILEFEWNDREKFDVITCMMGTACEFFGESLSALIEKMYSLAKPGAFVFVSVYNAAAINQKKFIHIYDECEKERLALKMLKANAITELFEKSGFEYIDRRRPGNLHILRFKKKKIAKRKTKKKQPA